MNTTGSIGYLTNGWAIGKLLKRAQALMVLERFGQVDPQGMNKSATRRYRRLEAFPVAIAPVAEGISPAGQSMIITDLNVTLQQYADAVPFTDVIQDTIEDNTLDDLTKAVAQQAAETKEVVRFNAIKGGSNVYYGGTGTTRATVNGPITRGLLRKVYRTLKRNRAAYISEIIAATAKIGTQAVAAAYFGVGHTDLDADFQDVTGWKRSELYSDIGGRLPGEIGSVENFRLILSDLFTPWAAAGTSTSTLLTGGANATGACDVYPVLIFGQDSYGIVPLQGKDAVKIYVVNPTATSADPVAQKGSVGWKMMDAALILNDMWMARAEVGASQL